MEPIDENELRKRQINANAFALNALAAFARYRTSLPVSLTSEERVELLDAWAKTAMAVVGQEIDELMAYEQTDAKYESAVQEFVINMATLSFLEVNNVLSYNALVSVLSESCSTDLLAEALRKKKRKDLPELPENIEYTDRNSGEY